MTRHGGPDVLTFGSVDDPIPAADEVIVRTAAVGVNFIDTYHRSGLYPMQLPSGIGVEAAGVVEAVGEGVTHVAPGDRVVYFAATPGSYATHRVLDAKWLVKLPDDLSD